jgi:thioredoxin reductase (NADPH)
MTASAPPTTIAVIGAGAAGMSAALHAARRGHDLVVLDPLGPGGQLVNAGVIDTLPGLSADATGPDLVARLVEQLAAYDVTWIPERAVQVRGRADRFLVVTDAGTEAVADAVVVASGSSLRTLDVPGARELVHRGVSDCAVCDGPLFRDRPVAVVGGGDAAAEAAAHLSTLCSRVHLVHRGEELAAIAELRRRVDGLPNIERRPNTELRSVVGRDAVEAVEIEPATGPTTSIPVAALFVAVGVDPDTSPVSGLVELDPSGHVVVDASLATSIPGVFAAGAVRGGSSGQLAGAIGDGVTAAVSADRWLRGVSTPVDATAAPAPTARREAEAPRSEFVDYADFFDSMDKAGVGDGLPLVPPTRARVDHFAAAIGASADDELASLPDGRRLSYRDLVTSSILAGCRPEYLPAVLAATRSFLADLADRQARLRDAVSVIVVNGPVRNAIDLNCSDALFGPGWRANATIGRALQLFVRTHLGVGPPVAFGDPGQITFCFGEDEEKSPWVPLHVQRGFDADESAVTVFHTDVYRHMLDRAHADADGIVDYLRLFLRGQASGTRLFGDVPLSLMIVVGEELRRQLAPRYSKAALGEELFRLLTAADGTPFGPIDVRGPDAISIIGAGGLATPALWCFVSTTPPPRTVRVVEHAAATTAVDDRALVQ